MNSAENNQEDLFTDLVSVIYSFCTKLYGLRRAKRTTEGCKATTDEGGRRMRLVEQHVISSNDPRYHIIDAACFASKNLYNAANYLVRQSFIHEGIYLGYATVYH